MLLFDLENEQTAVEINGHEYDKDTLIRTFDSLRNSWDFHLKLYQNKPLLDFLEKGKVLFFRLFNCWKDFEDSSFRIWIQPIFVDRYSQLMYKCATVKSVHSLRNLKVLCQSKFPMPPSFRDVCFEKTHSHFHHIIEKGKRKYENPIKEKLWKRKTLTEGLNEYLSDYYLSVLQILPSYFNPIKEQYGHFAHSILYKALHKGKYITQFDSNSLITLNLCTQISWALIDNQSAKDIQKDILWQIERKQMSMVGFFRMDVWIYLILLTFFFILFFRLMAYFAVPE